MKGTDHIISEILSVLQTLSPRALRRVLAYAKRQRGIPLPRLTMQPLWIKRTHR